MGQMQNLAALEPDLLYSLVSGDFANHGSAGSAYDANPSNMGSGTGPYLESVASFNGLSTVLASGLEIPNFSNLMDGAASIEVVLMTDNPAHGGSARWLFRMPSVADAHHFGAYKNNANSEILIIGRFAPASSSYQVDTPGLADGTWDVHRFTYGFNAERFKVWTGAGDAIISAAGSGGFAPEANRSLWIGQRGNDTQTFNGLMAYLAFFVNRSLTDATMTTLRNETVSGANVSSLSVTAFGGDSKLTDKAGADLASLNGSQYDLAVFAGSKPSGKPIFEGDLTTDAGALVTNQFFSPLTDGASVFCEANKKTGGADDDNISFPATLDYV